MARHAGEHEVRLGGLLGDHPTFSTSDFFSVKCWKVLADLQVLIQLKMAVNLQRLEGVEKAAGSASVEGLGGNEWKEEVGPGHSLWPSQLVSMLIHWQQHSSWGGQEFQQPT